MGATGGVGPAARAAAGWGGAADSGSSAKVKLRASILGARIVTSTDYRHFVMSFTTGEPTGYMAMCQAANDVIHLITSKTHYAFNLAWLKSPIPAAPTARD